VGLALFGSVFLSIYVRAKTRDLSQKKDNCVMTFWLTLLAVFLMWVMWICAFMHQMYPLARLTVSKAPEYKLRCAEDKICVNFNKKDCEERLFDYEFLTNTDGTTTCLTKKVL
jgi:hypothetical protein